MTPCILSFAPLAVSEPALGGKLIEVATVIGVRADSARPDRLVDFSAAGTGEEDVDVTFYGFQRQNTARWRLSLKNFWMQISS